MGETVAEIDESHFFQAHRIMTFFSEFSICNRSHKTAKKRKELLSVYVIWFSSFMLLRLRKSVVQIADEDMIVY